VCQYPARRDPSSSSVDGLALYIDESTPDILPSWYDLLVLRDKKPKKEQDCPVGLQPQDEEQVEDLLEAES
jgi:hypothetical protein